MKRWITADWHLGEDRFQIMQRPFSTAQEHVDALVAYHNALVAPDDEVIVAGDVCYQKRPEFLEQVARFNGRKTLIRGNHDEVISDADFLKYFDIVVGHGCGIEMDLGFPAYATHYPTRGRPDRFNLVGHIHTAWKVQLNMVNIGVDANHFRPHDLANMRFFFQAITDFYDDDVWIGYSPINLDYASKRGKPGSYFKEEKK
jgi:calcineurin-like phosphoesterase family protein